VPPPLPKSQLRQAHKDGLQERYRNLVGMIHNPLLTARWKTARDLDLVARFFPPPPPHNTPPPWVRGPAGYSKADSRRLCGNVDSSYPRRVALMRAPTH